MSIEELTRRKSQQQVSHDKNLCVQMCTDIMLRLDKVSIDNAMNILCACAASTIRNRLHNTQYMEGVGQFATQIHGMIFGSVEINKEQQEIKEAVLADLAEVEQWANRGKFIVANTDKLDIIPASGNSAELMRFVLNTTNSHFYLNDVCYTREKFIKWLDEQLILQARQGIKKENSTPVVSIIQDAEGETKIQS